MDTVHQILTVLIAVRFQISQIGNDSSAADFLQQLKEDDELTEWLYCTTRKYFVFHNIAAQ